MSHFQTEELVEQLEQDEANHLEVLDEESLTVEISRYSEGEYPPGNVHDEDELYYILSGAGTVEVADEMHSIEGGDVVYVERGTEHGFVEVDEDITVVIAFVAN
jgi:quercetin dioxygenase-like cupin family protein